MIEEYEAKFVVGEWIIVSNPEDDAIPYMNEIGEITRVPKYEGGFYEVDFGEEGEEDFFEFLEEEMEVYRRPLLNNAGVKSPSKVGTYNES
jgi:hypothetical protein